MQHEVRLYPLFETRGFELYLVSTGLQRLHAINSLVIGNRGKTKIGFRLHDSYLYVGNDRAAGIRDTPDDRGSVNLSRTG